MSNNLTLVALILLLTAGGDVTSTQTLLLLALLSTGNGWPSLGQRNQCP